MIISTASDAQHQDLGAIEAAVRETARGRAFLANYARRVQQSDTLTMLATLGRLERLSEELAARIAELEAVGPQHVIDPVSQAAGLLPHGTTLTTGNEHVADAMQRIDELASVLGSLHHHAVQLASQCGGVDGRGPAASSIELDARAFVPPDPALLSAPPATADETADEEVLGKIAQALEC